jgi:uncharacterized caspase-like protein
MTRLSLVQEPLRKFLFALILCSLAPLSTAQAYEEAAARHALVIGVKNYEIAPLRNSLNDAHAIAASLADIGFQVVTLSDPTQSQLRDGIASFYANIVKQQAGRALALVYYAGHAVQIQHHNYLVPLDVDFGSAEKFGNSLFDVNDLFAQIPSSLAMQNIIVLDACRNNPFAGDTGSGIAAGLAPMSAPADTLIAYATEPGKAASDGSGSNGIYTRHLLRHLEQEITVEEVFKKVRRGVAKETQGRQIPWEHSSLLQDVFINPPRNRGLPDLLNF